MAFIFAKSVKTMKHHRLKQLLEALDVKPAKFETRFLGESRAKNIYGWISGEFNMKAETIEKIIEVVKAKRPDFNADWFRDGTGEMFEQITPVTYGEGGYDFSTVLKENEALKQKLAQMEDKLKYSEDQNKVLSQYVSDLRSLAMGKKVRVVTPSSGMKTKKVGVAGLRLANYA